MPKTTKPKNKDQSNKIDFFSDLLKTLIKTLFSITIIIFLMLVWTYSYPNEYTIPIILMIFFWFIILILYLFYIKFVKKIFLVLIVLLLIYICFSMIKGILYEHKVDKLYIGMTKVQVENLYWIWTSGVWFWPNGLWSARCLKCNWKSYQFSYNLNTNFWYSHLEDSYHICYIDDMVCDFDRIGL